MLKYRCSNRRGGIVIFLCIFMSALILSQCILLNGSLLRSNEAEIFRASHLQAENVLCDYHVGLYDHYGVYAFNESALTHNSFSDYCRVKDIESVTISGLEELSPEGLETLICDYMKIRFPAMIGSELITRIAQAVGRIRKSDLVTTATSAPSSALRKYLGEYLSSAENWSEIFENVENFVDMVDYSDKLSDFKSFINDLKETIKRVATMKLQGKSGSFELDVFDPECIEKIIELFSLLVDAETPEYLDYLYINKYAAALFDSSVSKIKEGADKRDEANIYGTSFLKINGGNRADLEYLLTGKEEKSAISTTKTMVFATRALLNLGTFLLDQKKLSESEGIADIICACVALLSAGTVAIDPTVVKYLVIVTWALQRSFQDMNKLADGGKIAIFDHSSLKGQEGIDALIQTRYRDYVEFFLMFVERRVLLSRMIEIFNRYSGGKLYVSVQINVQYSGREFQLEESYDTYRL